MNAADQQHLAWLARSFGRPDYLPLTVDDLTAITGAAEVVTRPVGSHLFREGEPAVAAYVVRDGEVELYRGSGRTRHIIGRLGPGAVLGDIAMFSHEKYLSSASPIKDVTAFRFDRDRLLPELARHPAICLRWLVAALDQLKETQRRVVHLMHKTVKGQVADLLMEEADHDGSVRLSQATLATLLGASRQTVNEALGELKNAGVVETGYREIRVLDSRGLRRASRDG